MLLGRRELYDRSDPVQPRARQEERQILIDLLQIEPHHVVCDVPAWCGYFAEGVAPLLTSPTQVICVEPSPRFVQAIRTAFTVHCSQATALPLADASVDRLGSLVGMHHLVDKDAFVREAVRVVKPGGLVGLSEVVEGTAVATFLNGPVHRYTAAGHTGAFMHPGECTELLTRAGCVDVVEQVRDLHWVFPSEAAMATFCYGLLGMTKTDEATVLKVLKEHFDVVVTGDGIVKLPWSLVYAIGTKKPS